MHLLNTLNVQGKLEKQKNLVQDLVSIDGVLYFWDQLFIPNHNPLKEKIIFEAHDIPIATHPGYIKSYATIWQGFYWHGMKRDILNYVTQCLTCQKIKVEHVKYPRETTTTGYSTHEMGIHFYGFYYKFT